jgi:hypothetical protein
MSRAVRLACQPQVVEVPLDHILPTRVVEASVVKTSKFKCIEASVRELGLIEPLAVYPQPKAPGRYLLLDGHLRWSILKTLGAATAKCLIATDDEGYTYNHKVNRLSAIQEHFMIIRATKNGVSDERIARTLNVDLPSIRQKRELLDGICDEAVEILRDSRATAVAVRQLRKVKPMRQIEISELMCAADNFSEGYVKCLVAVTAEGLLVDGERRKDIRGLSQEDLARMEFELDSQSREFRLIEESHGKNVLNLVLVVGYLKKLIENARVSRYLAHHFPEIQVEFQKLCEARTLMDGASSKAIADSRPCTSLT